MDKLILKQIDNDKLIDEAFIIGNGYFLVYPKYFKELKLIYHMKTEELIETIEDTLLLKVLVLNPRNITEPLSVLMKCDRSLKDFLLNQVVQIKQRWVIEQQYEKAAFYRDLEKRILSIDIE